MARPSRALLPILLAVGAAAILGCDDDDDDPTSPSTNEPWHLLVVTHTTGYRHESIPAAEQVLAGLAQESGGLFDVTFCRNGADVAALMTPAALGDFDGVFFANTSGNLGIPDMPAFLDWIRAGHPFLGAHSACGTYLGHAGYAEMLGADLAGHGQQCEVDVTVEDAGHPASAPLHPTLRIFDEIYELTDNPRGRVSVLLSLDRHPPDGHAEAGQPGDFVLAWHKSYGQGRVFYTALGHREDVWLDGRYRSHLRGAIEWALSGAGSARAAPPASRARRPIVAPRPAGPAP